MLIEMMESHPVWDEIPLDKQDIFRRMALIYQSTDDNLRLTAEELVIKTKTGERHQWWEFLDLEPVEHYIKMQQQRLTKVNQRKTLNELMKAAQSEGNVGAMKEINALSGIMEKQDNNKVVILHYIPRGKVMDGEESVQSRKR